MVKLALPENNQTILASQYKLYLPTEQQLLDEMRKNIELELNKGWFSHTFQSLPPFLIDPHRNEISHEHYPDTPSKCNPYLIANRLVRK